MESIAKGSTTVLDTTNQDISDEYDDNNADYDEPMTENEITFVSAHSNQVGGVQP